MNPTCVCMVVFGNRSSLVDHTHSDYAVPPGSQGGGFATLAFWFGRLRRCLSEKCRVKRKWCYFLSNQEGRLEGTTAPQAS